MDQYFVCIYSNSVYSERQTLLQRIPSMLNSLTCEIFSFNEGRTPSSGLINDLVFKNTVSTQSYYDFQKNKQTNEFQQHLDKPDLRCQPLANLSDRPTATLR